MVFLLLTEWAEPLETGVWVICLLAWQIEALTGMDGYVRIVLLNRPSCSLFRLDASSFA